MATQAQIEANRQNAQKSTGPRTEAGKAKSSQNALTHGLTATGESLLPHEAQSSYYRFHQEMIDSLHPGSPIENMLVHRITDTLWRLQRVPNAEAQLFSALAERARDKVQKENEEEQEAYEKELRWKKPEDVAPLDIRPLPPDPSAAEALAQAFLKKDSRNPFMRLQRYEQALNRTLHRTMYELRELQRERAKNPRDEHGQLLQERVEILQEKVAYFCDRSLSLQKQLEHLQQAQPAPRQNEANSSATPEKTSPSRTSSPEKPAPRLSAQHAQLCTSAGEGPMTRGQGQMTAAPVQNKPNSAPTAEKTSSSRTASPEKPAPKPHAPHPLIPKPQSLTPLPPDIGPLTADKAPDALASRFSFRDDSRGGALSPRILRRYP